MNASAAAAYLRVSRSASNWRAYESDWRIFAAWLPLVRGTCAARDTAHRGVFLAPSTLGHAPITLAGASSLSIRLMHRVRQASPSPHDSVCNGRGPCACIRNAWKRPPTQKALRI